MHPSRGVLAALLLAGCTGSQRPALEAGPVRHVCDDGRVVTVLYREDGARLEVDGQRHELYPVVAASGARYGTEQGLSPDMGLIWWTKGEEAVLQAMPLDHTATEADRVTLATCRVAG